MSAISPRGRQPSHSWVSALDVGLSICTKAERKLKRFLMSRRSRRRAEQALDPAELVAEFGHVTLAGALLGRLEAQHELPAGLEDPPLYLADIVPVLDAHRVIELTAPQPQVH
jgi:hypothetical protein